MSILNSPFGGKEAFQAAYEESNALLATALPNLDPATQTLIEATRDGSSLGDVLGVTKAQKQALLDLGCRFIQMNELEKASDVLLRLAQLDPLEERASYALGLICQMRGELHKAAQLYLQFLALDATNPLGYLRLGECLLAAREHAEARGAFEMAEALAADGKGEPGCLADARKMLALPELAPAAN